MQVTKLKSVLIGQDWILNGAIIFLVTTGLVSLFSITGPGLVNFYKQLIWLVLGLGAFLFFSSVDYRIFRIHYSPVLTLYFVAIAGLLAVAVFGTPIRGAQRWITLGPINFEPVALLNLSLILILAKYFSNRHVEMYRLRNIIISGIYILIPSILILKQPDLGSFILLAVLWVGVIVVSGIPLKQFAVLSIVIILLSVWAWGFLLADYQKARVSSFLNPEADPYGSGYNAMQSLIAVGSGGFWGKGIYQGTQSQLGFLPEPHTDFIYAAVIEEFGVFMGLIIIVLYGILLWRILSIARYATDNFARLAMIGITIVTTSHIVFNMGMVLGLLPITGLTLPFISYGGSSLIMMMATMGLAQAINKNSIKSALMVTEDKFSEAGL